MAAVTKKIAQFGKKLTKLWNLYIPYPEFCKIVKGSSEYSANIDVKNLTDEMSEISAAFRDSLQKLTKFLYSLNDDKVFEEGKKGEGTQDLIAYYLGEGPLTAKAKSFAGSIDIALVKSLTRGTKPTNVLIEKVTLSDYLIKINSKVSSEREKLDKLKSLSKLKDELIAIDEQLGDSDYDTQEKGTIAGIIKRYKAEWFKDSISLKVMENIFPEVKSNIEILNNKIKDLIINIATTNDVDVKTLEKAVKFLNGSLALDPASVAEINSIVPKFVYSKETKIKAIRKNNRRIIVSEANLKTLTDERDDLYNYGVSLTEAKAKGFINRHKIGIRNTIITLGVVAGLVALSGGVYHLTDYVKGKENLNAQSNTVDSGIIEESDSVNTAFIKLYQEGVANRISELKQKAEDEAWAVRLNGQDALNKLKAYIDGTNKNLGTLNSYNEDALAGISSNDLIAVRSLMELYYNAIIADLGAIEDSVGVMLTQNVSKDTFEQVNFTTLKTATGNSIQSVSVDFVKDENGNYDSKMEIVVKSYDSMTKKEFYKYFVISTEDALTYLTDGELLDVNAIQAIQDNGKITKSGIDYKYILENEGTYLPQEVSHIYMNGVSEAIKKGKYTVSYKVVLVDGTTIENNIDVENLKATNQTAVVKAVYKNIFSLIESKIEANENLMQ